MRTMLLCVMSGLSLALAACASAPHIAGSEAEVPPAEPSRIGDEAGRPASESLRSPIRARVLDRRFRTREAMYLANEMQIGGDSFLMKMFQAGMPIGDDRELQHITAIESYWYSRYNMSALVAESRLGVHIVHGPYVTEKALEEGVAADNRYRGERIVSNKTALIQRIVPDYLARTGFPRRFEDASPTMLQFASGDPHYPQRIDKGTRFESVENRLRQRELMRLYGEDLPPKPSGMGEPGNDMWKYRVNYRDNFRTLRWRHDRMEHVVDMGAEGQTLLKESLWCEYFFRGQHHGGRYLGNNPEEGYRGAMLNLGAVSKMLILKAALLYDGRRLTGANPMDYDPNSRLLYFPHRIAVRMRYTGDLPPHPEEFKVVDPSSQLFDQASLLWGLTEYYYFSDPTTPDSWDAVFGDNPPYDGSIMEQKYAVLAQGLANLVLANIAHQHRADGEWSSAWTPEGGPSRAATTTDLALTMIGLANYHRHMHIESENREQSADMLRELADFFLDALQSSAGHFADGFDYSANAPVSNGAPSLEAQAFAVRALLEAHRELGDDRYFSAARSGYDFMNAHLWDDAVGVYRSAVGAERTIYTPINLGAALGAMREMILATGDMTEVERFKRFFVQAVNSSGIQQAEYEETGERDLSKADGDGDGIKRIEFAGGRHGIAPVFASMVEIMTPIDRARVPGGTPESSK